MCGSSMRLFRCAREYAGSFFHDIEEFTILGTISYLLISMSIPLSPTDYLGHCSKILSSAQTSFSLYCPPSCPLRHPSQSGLRNKQSFLPLSPSHSASNPAQDDSSFSRPRNVLPCSYRHGSSSNRPVPDDFPKGHADRKLCDIASD